MKKPLIITAALVLVTGLVYLQSRGPSDQGSELATKTTISQDSKEHSEQSEKPVTEAPQANEASAQNDAPQEKASDTDELPEYLQEYTALPEQHRRTLITQVKTLTEHGKRGVDHQDLTRQLEQKGLRPEVRVDENPYTGRLNVVRTRSVLPGTRNFHAQYFDDVDGSEYIQHMSFEFRPSEQSFAAVEATLLNEFGSENMELSYQNEHFRSWRTGEGYILWMKQLQDSDIEDMKADPFNVYTMEDVGVIRVALELDIHDHAPAFHAEQGSPDEE